MIVESVSGKIVKQGGNISTSERYSPCSTMNYPAPRVEVSNRGTDDQGTQNYEVQEYADRQRRSTENGVSNSQ